MARKKRAAEKGTKRPGGPSPTALAAADLARLLTQAGGRPLTEEMVRADVEAGAPTNRDGTLNLVHYAAWLVRCDVT